MVNARRQFVFKMRYHHQRLILTGTKSIDDTFYLLTVEGIQPMQGFVKDQQFRVFHKGPCQQHHTLFAITHLQERSVCQMSHTKCIHPLLAHLTLPGLGFDIQANRVMQSTRHNVNSWQVLQVSTMHLRTHVTNVFLNVPNALARTSFIAKQTHIAGITLRIVGTDNAQQS